MEEVRIAKTAKTPAVYFNPEERYLEILGVSIPEDADSFYTPLLDWIAEYVPENVGKPTTIALKLIYFNTATSDYLVTILKNLKDIDPNTNNTPPTPTNEDLNAVPSEEVAEEALIHEEVSPTDTTDDEDTPNTGLLRVEWHYEEEDEDMRETGTHFESIIELPFVYFAVEEIN